MTDSPAENRKILALEKTDVALIFKEDGHVDLSFPNDFDDYVPDHVMAALSISYAMMDDDFFELIQNRYKDEIASALNEDLNEDLSEDLQDDYYSEEPAEISGKPKLVVVK